MSVYHVYTKKAHVPVFVLYRCQKCKKVVAVWGTFDFSASYTDRGAWSAKRVREREEDATMELTASANGMQSFLRKDVMQVIEDYRRIQCKCPHCGHLSLGKLGNIDLLKTRFARVMLAAAILFAAFMGIQSKSINTFLGGLLFGVPAGGLLTLLFGSIMEKINARQMKSVIRETIPLISANKKVLMNEADKSREYQGADFSAIQDQPDIL